MGAIYKPTWPQLQRGDPLARGLIFALMLTEGAGVSLRDASDNGNDGVAHLAASPPIWVPGANGWELKFNGSSNYVDMAADPLSGATAFTIIAQITPRTAAGNAVAIYQNWGATAGVDRTVLIRGTAGALQFFTYTSAGQAGGSISTYAAGSPYVFGFTYDGATMRATRDGVVSATTYSQSGALLTTSVSPGIGGRNIAGNLSEYFLDGTMGWIVGYDRALPTEDLLDFYQRIGLP